MIQTDYKYGSYFSLCRSQTVCLPFSIDLLLARELNHTLVFK